MVVDVVVVIFSIMSRFCASGGFSYVFDLLIDTFFSASIDFFTISVAIDDVFTIGGVVISSSLSTTKKSLIRGKGIGHVQKQFSSSNAIQSSHFSFVPPPTFKKTIGLEANESSREYSFEALFTPAEIVRKCHSINQFLRHTPAPERKLIYIFDCSCDEIINIQRNYMLMTCTSHGSHAQVTRIRTRTPDADLLARPRLTPVSQLRLLS